MKIRNSRDRVQWGGGNMGKLISLGEYAKLHGIDPATARQRAGRGAFKTAQKIARNWVIDEDEEYIDHRKKPEK